MTNFSGFGFTKITEEQYDVMSAEVREEWETHTPEFMRGWIKELSFDGFKAKMLDMRGMRLKREAQSADNKAFSAKIMAGATTSDSNPIDLEKQLNAIDIAGIAALALGVSAGAAGALLYHPNPHKYYAKMAVLVKALTSLKDSDTRLNVNQYENRTTVTVMELIGSRWEDALEIKLTESAEFTTVEVGPVKFGNLLSKITGLGRSLIDVANNTMSHKQSGLLGTITGVLDTVTGLAGEIKDRVAGKVQDLMVKFRIWKVMDEAAKPFEDAYWDQQDEAARTARKEELEAGIREALKSCPGCNTPYTGQETSCPKCGTPRSAESLESLATPA